MLLMAAAPAGADILMRPASGRLIRKSSIQDHHAPLSFALPLQPGM